jgi:hypothetical protein
MFSSNLNVNVSHSVSILVISTGTEVLPSAKWINWMILHSSVCLELTEHSAPFLDEKKTEKATNSSGSPISVTKHV